MSLILTNGHDRLAVEKNRVHTKKLRIPFELDVLY
jgi:hypothetical protein